MGGKLFLIPSFLSDNVDGQLPSTLLSVADRCDVFVVENARTARRFLRAIGFTKNFDTEVTICEMPKHEDVRPVEIAAAFERVLQGANVGIISEAGNPCIADPGARYVAFAHANCIEVVPLVGPSSILLALMASGFNGQQFTFHGYLPLDQQGRVRKIRELEQLVAATGYTQLFMETPYRNNSLMKDIVKTCGGATKLCVACDITGEKQFIRTMAIQDWKKALPDLHKRPCIFLLGHTA